MAAPTRRPEKSLKKFIVRSSARGGIAGRESSKMGLVFILALPEGSILALSHSGNLKFSRPLRQPIQPRMHTDKHG